MSIEKSTGDPQFERPLSTAPAGERDHVATPPAGLPLPSEKRAAEYLQSAISNGHAHQLLADLNTLDGVLRELGMQDTGECPIERVRMMSRAPSSDGEAQQ